MIQNQKKQNNKTKHTNKNHNKRKRTTKRKKKREKLIQHNIKVSQTNSQSTYHPYQSHTIEYLHR